MKQEHAVYLLLVWEAVFFSLLSLFLDVLCTLYFSAILQGLSEDRCKYYVWICSACDTSF